MLLGTLGVSLSGKWVIRPCEGAIATRNKYRRTKFLKPPHYLTNFEIQKYYRNKPKFDGGYSRNRLPEIKNGTYVKSIDEYRSIGTLWITLCVNGDNMTYFNSFRVEHISIEIIKFISNKNIKNTI